MSRSRGLQTGLHSSVKLCLQGPTSRSSCRADLHPSDAASSTSLYLKARPPQLPCGHCGLLQSKGFTSVKCRRGAMSAPDMLYFFCNGDSNSILVPSDWHFHIHTSPYKSSSSTNFHGLPDFEGHSSLRHVFLGLRAALKLFVAGRNVLFPPL